MSGAGVSVPKWTGGTVVSFCEPGWVMVSDQVHTPAALSGTSEQIDEGLMSTGPRSSAFFSQDAAADTKKVP